MIEFDMTDLVRKLKGKAKRIENYPMQSVGALLMEETDSMFDTEGAAGVDGPWRPLAESTLEAHPRRRGGMILQDTGAMANVQITKVGDFSVTIASPTGYAGFHITGTSIMPKRDFFALNFAKVLDRVGDDILQEMDR